MEYFWEDPSPISNGTDIVGLGHTPERGSKNVAVFGAVAVAVAGAVAVAVENRKQ